MIKGGIKGRLKEGDEKKGEKAKELQQKEETRQDAGWRK